MMKSIALFFLSMIILSSAYAQSTYFTITGIVKDAAGNAPLQGASVYAENTTLGTATDADGKFLLSLPNGGYNLIVSFTGYNTTDMRVSNLTASNPLSITMSIKEKAMQEVAIVSNNEVKNGWDKYGKFFLDEFIGTTPQAAQCKVKNPEILKFYFSKRKNRLKVLAAEPLLIENNALGYTIKYDLDSFVHEYNAATTVYTGYPLFEEMMATDTAVVANWQKAREEVYYGSLMHFMRSLYRQQLKEDGFEIHCQVPKILDMDTMAEVKDYYFTLGAAFNDDHSLMYLQQQNGQITGILYNDAAPDAAYLKENADAPAAFQFSTLKMMGNEKLTVERNGYYYDPNELSIADYWEWCKMANTLPFDYWPK